MFRLMTCVTAGCDDCGTDYEQDDYIVHYPDQDAAIRALSGHAGWRVRAGGRLTCPDCAAEQDCATYGHPWEPWRRCGCTGHILNHHADSGGTCTHQVRWCDRCSRAQHLGPAEPAGRPDLVPDEAAILAALRNLNLGPLSRQIEAGWTPRWVQPAIRDGRGWRAQLDLPPGVTVAMITAHRAALARHLSRSPIEVHPTEPAHQPGVLDLRVADHGAPPDLDTPDAVTDPRGGQR